MKISSTEEKEPGENKVNKNEMQWKISRLREGAYSKRICLGDNGKFR
jgi:hypothetical protein